MYVYENPRTQTPAFLLLSFPSERLRPLNFHPQPCPFSHSLTLTNTPFHIIINNNLLCSLSFPCITFLSALRRFFLGSYYYYYYFFFFLGLDGYITYDRIVTVLTPPPPERNIPSREEYTLPRGIYPPTTPPTQPETKTESGRREGAGQRAGPGRQRKKKTPTILERCVCRVQTPLGCLLVG